MRLSIAVLIEIAIGFTLAAIVLAVAIPLIVRFDLMQPGDTAGMVVVIGTIGAAIAIIVFRRGSALNRARRKDG